MSPMPREPPVTSATLPSIEKSLVSTSVMARDHTGSGRSKGSGLPPRARGPTMRANRNREGTAMGAAVKLDASVESFVHAPVRKMLIDGKWVEAASGKTFETPNPATGEVLARVAAAGPEDVERAVRAARRAFDEGPWPHTAPNERERFLLKVADLIEAHADELAQIETLDNGKPFMESRHVDIPGAAATFRYYAGWVSKIYGETSATLKRVSLELGGKSPNIVFSDADTEAAVQGALLGVFFCAGQVCCAGTRLFVEQKMHDEVAQKLAKSAEGMKQGNPFDPDTRVGPLVSKDRLERVTGYPESGKKEGAKRL